MSKIAVAEFRRTDDPPVADRPLTDRFSVRLGLSFLSVALLTLAYAPYHQFYLAWIGLTPWLLLVRATRSQKGAFFWSWLTGTMFFIANMWWLANVTLPGMVALMIWLGLYWGAAAVLIRGLGLLDLNADRLLRPPPPPDPSSLPRSRDRDLHPMACIFGIATIWVASEYIRGNYPFSGLPWLLIGHTQSPILPMAQIADAMGAFGISFWVVLINAWIAAFIINRLRLLSLVAPLIAIASILACVLVYGLFRLSQDTLSPGPTVMVVQPNFPQDNTGERSASPEEWVRFHLDTTRSALDHLRGQGQAVDLVVWSETMLPEINPEARFLLRGVSGGGFPDYGAFLDWTHNATQDLARDFTTAILAGGKYYNAWFDHQAARRVTDSRNSAFLFEPTGLRADARYDKIHLVPWGEYIPFKTLFPPLYRLFMHLSPYDYDYTLTPGEKDALTVFHLDTGRFVVPICFEDIDSALVARMFRPGDDGDKRADFIVNITNDGWFLDNEMPQHLQVAIFRSIENRAPTARSVNTGISGFIDSAGRIDRGKTIPVNQVGWRIERLSLDSRIALFTRVGNAFAVLCTFVTLALAMCGLVLRTVRHAKAKAASR